MTLRHLVRLAALLAACLATLTAGGQAQTTPLTCYDRAPTIVGTEGNDKLTGTPGDDVIAGLGGDDTITALGGNDRICGGAGADTILADTGDDLISGGDDGDGIDAGAGNDTIDGGEGLTDLAVFLTSPNGVRVDLAAHTASGEGSDTITGVEALGGTFFDDTLVGDEGSNFFFPFAGNDTVDGGAGFDLTVFLAPVDADLVRNRSTGEGNDSFVRLEGVVGGSGARNVLGGNGGDNFLYGFADANVIRGRGGDDLLFGGNGADRLEGGAGADKLAGGGGNDVLDGGAGSLDEASYLSSASGVRVDLARGTAVGAGSDRLRGIETVTGSQLADVLSGDGRSNWLYGNGGDDVLVGRGGADFLDGGSGSDRTVGAAGADYCVDGEARTSCEVAESTGAAARAAAASAGAAGAAPRRSCGRVRCLLRVLELRPLRQAVVQARLADTVHYTFIPQCNGGRRRTTSVAPPTDVGLVAPPNRTQTVVWQGRLVRLARGGASVAYRTPIARAPIAGSGFPHVGTPFWEDAQSGRGYRKRIVRALGQPGRYRWQGTVTWVETNATVTSFIRPHLVKPGGRPSQYCAVGRG